MNRRPRLVAILLALAAVAATVGGCGSTEANEALATKPLPELLLDRSQWPSTFSSPKVLVSNDAQEALAEIDGLPPGGRVAPAKCQPAVPEDVVAMQGTRDETTLRVVLARGLGPLSTRRDQVEKCSSYTVTSDTGPPWEVRVQTLPPPTVDLDDAFASKQTQTGGWIFNALTLVGQLGDVRVIAQVMGSAGEPLDTTALDGVFTAQVQTLRRAG